MLPKFHAQYSMHATLEFEKSSLKFFVYKAFTLYGTAFQQTSTKLSGCKSLAPHLFYVAIKDSVCSFLFSVDPNNRIIYYFLFLQVLRCFSSLSFHSLRNNSGIPGSKIALHLAKAYRSLPRPSSALKPSYPLTGVIELFYSDRFAIASTVTQTFRRLSTRHDTRSC